MIGQSIITVTIGDKNDRPMKEGLSSIFTYGLKGNSKNSEISRAYVEDPDDWDLGDKNFTWISDDQSRFKVDQDTEMICMLKNTPSRQFSLKFRVFEAGEFIPRHEVFAYVNVTVKKVPEEAVTNSGSSWFVNINAKQFVTPHTNGVSKKDKPREELATVLSVPEEKVDMWTKLKSPHHNNDSLLDVRFYFTINPNMLQHGSILRWR